MIKPIIFDAGELLFPLPRDLWAKKISELEEKYKVPQGRCAKAWGEVKPLIMEGKIKYLDAQEMIFKKAGFGEHTHDVAIEWIETDNELRNTTQPFKGVKETLHQLKRDYKLAVLSDTYKTESEKRKGLKRMGIDFFDKVFCSNDLGVHKPNPEAYQKVLDYFNVTPHEAVFVAHDCKELEGAKNVGIKTISVNEKCPADFHTNIFTDIIIFLREIE